MLPSKPPTSEKTDGIAGETSRAKPIPYEANPRRGVPLGQQTETKRYTGYTPAGWRGGDGAKLTGDTGELPSGGEIENEAAEAGLPEEDEDKPSIDFLKLVREAEDQSLLYLNQVNRKSWAQAYRAFHNEHFVGSKYTKPDWRNRSKLFVPKTRSAVRKDQAAVAASLFNNIDAINCMAGNESDPKQRAAADVMEQLVNYRTDRTSGRAALPWFLVSMGARQDALLTGVCVSKQSWKLKLRKSGSENYTDADEGGASSEKTRDVFVADLDRPDVQLVPPENCIIDPAADWTNPIQSAAYVILKWPMRIEEVRERQTSPVNPWKQVPEEVLRNSMESSRMDLAAIRRARELGLDRLDETQTGTHFQILWIYETFVRAGDDDWTFYSVGDREYLTDPRPVREVYPEQFGDRPLAYGYGSLESHRIYPMSPAEAWQMLQLELNDFRNLQLDAIKQNVMPVSKVVRGRQIDMDQVKRRSSGSSIIVTDPKDVTWERPPDVPQSAPMMVRTLDLEFDDLAGQFNASTTENNNALSRTLGGLKLVAGSANAVQEFDIRVWIQTWAEPVLAQIVRLEQYYEADPVVLGIAGDKAQLFEKYGINRIDDELLEQQITIRVSVGLGAGDPQARLAKFQAAVGVAMPLLQTAKEFQDGSMRINVEGVMDEIFGGAGYHDGGKRFITKGPPSPNPLQDLKSQEIAAKIEKDKKLGQAAMLTGLANVSKVQLGNKELEAESANKQLDVQLQAVDMGHTHAMAHKEHELSQTDKGHQHGLAIRQHHAEQQNAAADREAQAAQVRAKAAEGGGGKSAAPPAPAPEPAEAPAQSSAPQRPVRYDFVRDPRSGRIIAARPVYADDATSAQGGAQAAPQPQAPTPMGGGPGQEVPLPPFAMGQR